MTIAYKVTSIKNTSWNWRNEDEFTVEYTVGEWVRPKIKDSKLFVFKELYYAKTFMPGRIKKIWRCEIQNPSPAPEMILLTSRDISCFWQPDYQLNYLNSIDTPYGSLCCDAIKLLELIYQNQNETL